MASYSWTDHAGKRIKENLWWKEMEIIVFIRHRDKKKPSTTNQSTYTPFGAHHLRWRQKCKFDEKNENNQTDGNLLSGYHALALKSKNRRIHTKNKQQNRTVFELYDVLKSQYFNSFDMVSSYFCYCCFSFSFAWHIVLNCSHFMF